MSILQRCKEGLLQAFSMICTGFVCSLLHVMYGWIQRSLCSVLTAGSSTGLFGHLVWPWPPCKWAQRLNYITGYQLPVTYYKSIIRGKEYRQSIQVCCLRQSLHAAYIWHDFNCLTKHPLVSWKKLNILRHIIKQILKPEQWFQLWRKTVSLLNTSMTFPNVPNHCRKFN